MERFAIQLHTDLLNAFYRADRLGVGIRAGAGWRVPHSHVARAAGAERHLLATGFGRMEVHSVYAAGGAHHWSIVWRWPSHGSIALSKRLHGLRNEPQSGACP